VLLQVSPHWWERPLSKGLGVLILTLLIWMFFMVRLRRSQERSRLQAGFARALIHSQEEERKRLAGELHDSLGHDLLVLKGSLERESRSSSGGLSERLLALSMKTAGTVRQMRGISHALRPPGLERFGLGPALEALAHETEEATGIQISTGIGEIGRLAAEVELGLFRIAQVALSNMGRHSDASEGRLVIARKAGTIVLIVEDDGRGFDPEVPGRNSAGIGLTGMDERARLLGGTMHVVSRKTNGVRISISIPAVTLSP
jgi:signal transduction histidine kinase